MNCSNFGNKASSKARGNETPELEEIACNLLIGRDGQI